jgi:hypothetical protein
MDEKEPVVVYTTADANEAEVLRLALEAEGIECFVTGENQGGFSGVIPEITLLVHADQADEARAILESHPHVLEDDEESVESDPSDED